MAQLRAGGPESECQQLEWSGRRQRRPVDLYAWGWRCGRCSSGVWLLCHRTDLYDYRRHAQICRNQSGRCRRRRLSASRLGRMGQQCVDYRRNRQWWRCQRAERDVAQCRHWTLHRLRGVCSHHLDLGNGIFQRQCRLCRQYGGNSACRPQCGYFQIWRHRWLCDGHRRQESLSAQCELDGAPRHCGFRLHIGAQCHP